MECSGIMSSFNLDGVVAGAEPGGCHAAAVGMPYVTVTDAFLNEVAVFSPDVNGKRKKSDDVN